MSNNPVSQDQRARWLDMAASLGIAMSFRGEMILSAYTTIDDVLALCAAITAEAVEAERARVAEGTGITDAEIWGFWQDAEKGHVHNAHVFAFARALLAEQAGRERERCARWQPIETAPKDTRILGWSDNDADDMNPQIIIYPSYKGDTASWEIAWDGMMLHLPHEIPTHWMPLPAGPSAAAHRAGEEG